MPIRDTSTHRRSPLLALLHLILWLIHAIVRALASALVDVFTSLAGMLIALGVVACVAVGMASAFGLGGFSLWARRKRNRSTPE